MRREQDSGTQGVDVGFDAGSPLVQGQEAGVAADGATRMLLLVLRIGFNCVELESCVPVFEKALHLGCA